MRDEEHDAARQTLTPDEQRYVRRAQEDKFENGGIVRYYEQAVNGNASEAVLDAIELRMRSDFPREARKVFGAKGEQADELLTRVQQAVSAQFDLSGNGLGGHIKVGGDERRSGATAYLYRYLSYKAKGEHEGAQIALIQANAGAELRVMVRHYYTYQGAEKKPDEVRGFDVADIDAAQQAYLGLLAQLGVRRNAQAA